MLTGRPQLCLCWFGAGYISKSEQFHIGIFWISGSQSLGLLLLLYPFIRAVLRHYGAHPKIGGFKLSKSPMFQTKYPTQMASIFWISHDLDHQISTFEPTTEGHKLEAGHPSLSDAASFTRSLSAKRASALGAPLILDCNGQSK